MILLLTVVGKFVSFLSRIANLGAGATWSGEIVLRIRADILDYFSRKLKKGCILVVGTNGKTTTSLMIKKILEEEGNKVIHNESGANLLNGIVSAFISKSSWSGNINADWGVFEIDENSLPQVLRFITPKVLVILNLFRDQLDRYGEVDVIAEKWGKALAKLPKETKIILNADDPLIAHLGKSAASTFYFGLDDPKLFQKQMEHATDSIFCLNCGSRLTFDGIYYSHIGIWKCSKCKEKRPTPTISSWDYPLPGLYNRYNTLAAVSVAKSLGIADNSIRNALRNFSPAFGRQEEFEINGKKIKIFLAKNPAGFNESLRTVISLGAREILFALNDRIPDGRDVSWIWDVDFEMLPDYVDIIVSGDRVYDMALRIKYALESQNSKEKFKIYENVREAISEGLNSIEEGETLYILPTYSAMLEVRNILKGRKIL